MLSDEQPIDGSEILTQSEKESERVMLEIRLLDGIAHSSLSPEQLTVAQVFVGDGSLSAEAWQRGRIALTQKGRLVADRIVREILL
jgi:oxygen-independent coproporphyrinogen-3 oxidase